MSLVSKFVAFGKLQFKTSVNYRFEFMSSIILTPLTLMLYYFVWSSIFSNTSQIIEGYSFSQMMTYYILSMIIGHFIYNTVGNNLQEKITYGNLSQDLLKPMSVFQQFMAKTVFDRLFALVTEVLPVLVISYLLFDFSIVSFVNTMFFLISVVMALFLNFLLSYAVGLVAFWINRIEAIQWLMFIVIRFLSGEFIPLEFLGSALLSLSKYFPFYYLRYGPIQLFLGRFTIERSVQLMAIQLAWILGLYIIIRVIWSYAIKKFGAEGG
jgi:ABC-2 type transport system permease protein